MEQLVNEFKDKLINLQSDEYKEIVKEYPQLKEDIKKLRKDNKSLQKTIDEQSRMLKDVENDCSSKHKHVYVLIHAIIDPYFDQYDEVCGVFDHKYLVCNPNSDRDDTNFWEVKKVKMNE